ncbi:MAG: hypothetical protein GX180_11150 [Enterococcus sp.]|nr:hypothetical protein [Enterococcus sp.]
MKKKTIILILGLAIILISGFIITSRVIYNSRFESNYNAPADRKEAWLQDLTHFQKNYYKVCKSFPVDSIYKSNKIIDSIKENIDSFSDNKIKLLISHCVSMADDAHTAVYFRNFRRIPLRLYLFDDGLYVIKAKKGFEQYLGKEVVTICDKSIDELLEILDYYKSGNKSWIENESSYFLASPDFFEAANLSPTSDSIKYEFADKKDSFTSYLYPIKNTDQTDEYSSWMDLSPVGTIKTDTVGWKHVLNGLSLPLYLSYLNDEYHVEYFDSLKMMYIQINASNSSEGFNRAIKNFLDSNDVQHLIIDLRFNGGGDYTELAAFSKTIPQKVKGKIFIITGKATFSAGICIAARLKYFSKGRAIIIGQNSGDRLQFWAEGRQFSLPNSKIVARAVYGFHDWKNDNFELFMTHWINLFYGVAAKDLTPDVPVKLLFKDYYKGIDKTMTEITTLHNTRYSQ